MDETESLEWYLFNRHLRREAPALLVRDPTGRPGPRGIASAIDVLRSWYASFATWRSNR